MLLYMYFQFCHCSKSCASLDCLFALPILAIAHCSYLLCFDWNCELLCFSNVFRFFANEKCPFFATGDCMYSICRSFSSFSNHLDLEPTCTYNPQIQNNSLWQIFKILGLLNNYTVHVHCTCTCKITSCSALTIT